MNSPHWEHDCKQCTLLGTAVTGSKIWDVYRCPISIDRCSLIVRYSSEPSNYWSAPLSIARQLAVVSVGCHEAQIALALHYAYDENKEINKGEQE